jgi:hypothetical protein
MNTYLIICKGWIGDILFTSSVAERIKAREPDCQVDFWITLLQPKLLLENNPYIDDVYFGAVPPFDRYTAVYQMPELQQNIPATYQFQRAAGIEEVTLPFNTYTLAEMDIVAAGELQKVRDKYNKPPIVAIQANWDVKSRLYTEHDYVTKKPYYDAPYRNVDKIANEISKHCVLINAGFPEAIHQRHETAHNAESYAYTASVIKHCDFMVGGEGGLTNLAASVHTPVIMTTDFMWSLYGPFGSMKQFPELAMGPKTYYPEHGHTHLDPYLTDEEVAQQIIEIITHKGNDITGR